MNNSFEMFKLYSRAELHIDAAQDVLGRSVEVLEDVGSISANRFINKIRGLREEVDLAREEASALSDDAFFITRENMRTRYR